MGVTASQPQARTQGLNAGREATLAYVKRHKIITTVVILTVIAGIISTANGGWGAVLLAFLGAAAFVLARKSFRKWSAAVLSVMALLSVIGIVQLATSGPGDNYCLLDVSNNEDGGSGVLAVPQANATQSVCDTVNINTQQSFDQGGSGSMLAITGDKPGYVTACQQDHMTLFGMGDELPGWLVYSGTVAGIQAGGDGTTCG
jgi:energy-coupling factor transporter transmembrane protein EcfT